MTYDFLDSILKARRILFGLTVVCCAVCSKAQHVHPNAGAVSTAQGSKLLFLNGSNYATNAGYNVYLTFADSGSFSNLYQGAGMSFTALPSSLNNGGPAPGHAADGAFLQLEIVSVEGPAGGEFGIWMQEEGNPQVSQPLFMVPVGTTIGTNLLKLSESDGSAGSDPYGHIHGRTFTATVAGLYTIGCRIVETSSNGSGGGPIHSPSDLFYFYFQAGLTIGTWEKEGNSFSVTFGTATGKSYFVEAMADLAKTEWTTIAGPVEGDNHLATVTTNSPSPQLFFRLRSN